MSYKSWAQLPIGITNVYCSKIRLYFWESYCSKQEFSCIWWGVIWRQFRRKYSTWYWRIWYRYASSCRMWSCQNPFAKLWGEDNWTVSKSTSWQSCWKIGRKLACQVYSNLVNNGIIKKLELLKCHNSFLCPSSSKNISYWSYKKL